MRKMGRGRIHGNRALRFMQLPVTEKGNLMFSDYRPGLTPPPPRGIVFQNLLFGEPEVLPASSGLSGLVKWEGVYVILTDDITSTPRPFRALYFGESENLWGRATATHENYPAWQRAAGTFGNLYRAFHLMSGSTQHQRQMVETALISGYNPPCNDRFSFDFTKLLGGR